MVWFGFYKPVFIQKQFGFGLDPVINKRPVYLLKPVMADENQ